MPKYDAYVVKTFEYLILGIEADNDKQIYHKESLAKDERFKLEQPEKYGRLVDESIDIIEVEASNE